MSYVLCRFFFNFKKKNRTQKEVSNGNRSVIIRVITKLIDRAAGVRFVYHKYDYRPNWTTRRLITN